MFLGNETREKSGFVSYVSISLCFDFDPRHRQAQTTDHTTEATGYQTVYKHFKELLATRVSLLLIINSKFREALYQLNGETRVFYLLLITNKSTTVLEKYLFIIIRLAISHMMQFSGTLFVECLM